MGGNLGYALAALFLGYLAVRPCFKKDLSSLEKSTIPVLALLALINVVSILTNFHPAWRMLQVLSLVLLSFQIFKTVQIFLEQPTQKFSMLQRAILGIWASSALFYSLAPVLKIFELRWLGMILLAGMAVVAPAIFIYGSFVALYRKYQTTRRGLMKSQLKYFAAITLVCAFFIGTRTLAELGLAVIPLDWLGLSVWGLTLSLGLTKSRFPEFQLFAQQNILYALCWGTFLGLYLTVGLTLQMFAPSQMVQLSISAMGVIAALVLFPKLNTQFHRWTADVFYRKPIVFPQLLSKLLVRMNHSGSFEKLGEIVLRVFKNEIPLQKVAVVLLGEKRKRLWLHNDFDDFFLAEPEKVLNLLEAQHEIFLVDELLARKVKNSQDAMVKIQSAGALRQFQNSGVELVMPLVFGNQFRGYVLLGTKKSGEAFSQDEVNFMQDLGQYLIQTSFRLEIGQQQQDASHTLQSLHVASQALGSTHNFHDLLDKVVLSLLEMVRVDRGILFLYDEASDLLKGVAGYGAVHQDIEAIHLKVKDSVLGQIFRQGQAVYVPKVTHRTEHVRKLDVESYIAVPIKLKDRVIGLFALDNRVSGRSLEFINLKLLETLANQTAVAIENTRLYQEAQEKVLELSALVEEKNNLQLQVRRKDKLSALGTMAAGVAHEIKNPLASMKLFTEMMVDKYDDPEFWKKHGNIIGSEVLRLEKIVENFLGFARNHHLKLEMINVSAVLEKVLELVNAEAQKNNCAVLSQVAEKVPSVMADAHHLMQVFLNLVLNAVQAGSTQLRIECKALGQEQVQIDFQDNGCGIAEENLDKLFTPFFTTKEKGNGLGLSIIYKIIEEHHGHIMVTSKVGQGSTFSVLLPQAKLAAVPDNIIQMPMANTAAQVAQGS